MQGQAAHFSRYAPTKIQYGIDRYTTETKRLYKVLDTQLAKSSSGFLVGDHISIADVANLSWVIFGPYVDVDLANFPNLQKWEAMMSERPGISKGFHIPHTLGIKDKNQDATAMKDYQNKNSDWIIRQMKADHEDFNNHQKN